MFRQKYSLLTLLLFVTSLQIPAAAETIKIEAGEYDRIGVPVRCELSGDITANPRLLLISKDTKQKIPTQIDWSSDKPKLCWMLEQPLYAGENRTYLVVPADNNPQPLPQVRAERRHGAIKVLLGKTPVLEYNVDIRPSPVESPSYYARSGFIHPIYDPAGNILTDDFPPDHYHQHGIMFPYKKTLFRGEFVNFWEQSARLGDIFHQDVVTTITGPVYGGFICKLDHIAFPKTEKQTTVLNEVWQVKVYKTKSIFLVDFLSHQRCATDQPLLIQQNHYGGFAIRGRRNWSEGGDFLTSEGKSKTNGNHTRPNWVDIYGPVPSAESATLSGFAVLGHPDNFQAPQPVRLHPSMPYYCFAPMVLGDFKIKPGHVFTSRYRFVIHLGKAQPNEITRFYDDYANPIKVTFEK